VSDFEKYLSEFEKAQKYFESQISDREDKAFEYGTIVVRNAVLVSGGGLLAVPTIVSLASDVDVDVANASLAGVMFACALLVALFGAYVIHINWTLHSAAWHKHWEDRQNLLKNIYLDSVMKDELIVDVSKHFKKRISLTFYIPHILAIVFLVLIILGFYCLYSSLGVFGGVVSAF